MLERRIDRLIREADRDVVIDYKSGHPDDARKDRNAEQVRRYCETIRSMTGRACSGVLWYIDVDRDEVVSV